jgi:(5-formylfuran-3-yl)methyl phosphate synthase
LTASLPLPRLLVSVRDVAEARRAAEGGADIIDFKDPSRGPLGRADFTVVAQAADALRYRELTPQTPLSVALGEAHEIREWLREWDGRLPEEISWLKLGLSQFGCSPNWVRHWLDVRTAIEQRLSSPVQWVAVAYADAETAGAPQIDAVVEAAAQTKCTGVLIDTFDKSNGRLFDHLDRTQLKRISIDVRRHGLFFAVAGRVDRRDLPRLKGIGIDILGVRSAVCAGSDRQAGVSARRVFALRQQIRSIAASNARELAPPTPTPTPTASACRTGD